jgi:acetoin utilization protein AcuB
MLVEEIMNTNVATLSPQNTIADAINLMAEKKIRHIPIINDDTHVVGLITDRDIRDATPSTFYAEEHRDVLEKPLHTIMKTNIITGHPLDFVEEIAAVFYEHHISCLPIVKENKLAGIMTETDLLRTLVELTGAHQPGSVIEVRVRNMTGVLSDVTSVIKKRNASIQSVLVYPDKKDDAYKHLVIRLRTMNPMNIIEDLKTAGHTVLWPNLPGISS